MPREDVISATFVELADTLVDDFDVLDFLHTLAERSVRLLDVAAAGILLTDQRGGLQVMASSTEEARLLELFELQHDQGPCVDCVRTGRPVAAADLDEQRSRWPAFTERLLTHGFRAVQAIPLRLRDDTIGALNLFRTRPGRLTDADERLGQALADIATIGLIQERAIAERELLAEQLQTALNSRVVIEQAKGVLAERVGVTMPVAFQLMRGHARSTQTRLAAVANQVIDGSLLTIPPR